MTSDSSSQQGSTDRERRLRQVVYEVAQKRWQGAPVRDEDVLAQYPDLAPELADELAKLERITRLVKGLDEERCSRALQRLEHDWRQDDGLPDAAARAGLERSGEAAREDPSTWPAAPQDDDAVHPPRAAQQDQDAGRDKRQEDAVRQDAVWQDAAQENESPRDESQEFVWHIGRYRVHELLGQGGFGLVYRATDEELARSVAVKVPHQHRVDPSWDMEGFLAEARMIARLDHSAIVPVYDVGRTPDGNCYVVAKLIEGQNLAARIKQARPSPPEAARIVAVVADALHYAHLQGLVHRDVKPANILLDAAGRVYLTDFGLARRDEDHGQRRDHAGTPAYMSPEQARGEGHRVDGRSDVFSLGVVLYEMLAGRRPFSARSCDELTAAVAGGDPPSPALGDPSVSPELARICLKALSRRAADRYATAAEMGADLRDWLRHRTALPAPPAVAATPSWTEAAPAAAAKIVPKGLRPFDASDAEFFLELLPGARDRQGLPDGIRQWKTRIEPTEADETFAVGLVYGPSGCGKSSLVRAGLLPRLAPHVAPLYLEATPDDTEDRLRQRLLRQCPQLPAEADLAGCLAAVRRGRVLPPRHKLLLVIDQFEQWLHGKTEQQRQSLAEALRQCDGERLQCLLLVRDDFWLAVSRFMGELEIELVQGRNTALVDLFDPLHARKVLAEFGRAFGRLPAAAGGMSAGQEAFLDVAIAGLSDEDRVIPVRLALFAEMVKGRTWTPDTLQQVGGAAGVGVTFLEEMFSSRTANPQHRAHERAARAVLDALLPEPGSNLRGHRRSYPELLELSGYGHKPRAFKELMRILDSETRLLTPTEATPDQAAAYAAAASRRDYQLTHDYLVPSLRQWLTQRQQATRSGRAELRLAERSMLYNARPERRQLPSLWEWVVIRAFTRRPLWTAPQRKMMRAAARHYALGASTLAAMLLVFLFAGSELTAQAKHLLNRLHAETAPLWMALGQEETVWPLLRHDADPTLRTRLIHRLSPVYVDAQELVDGAAHQEDVSVRRAMLLIAGQLAGDPLEREGTARARGQPAADMVRELLRLYRDDPDPGVHAAAEWSLRRFGQGDEIARVDDHLRAAGVMGDRQWYVNSQGHTMVVIPGPTQFLMGSAAGEADDEPLHTRRIAGSFSIANKETTREQFEQFLSDRARFSQAAAPPPGLSPACPQTFVSWYDAAAYCNWLSGKEGIAREQWCYLPNEEDQYAAGMTIAADALQRAGYRLPSEAEWEFACRAGARTARHFGSDAALLAEYAVYGGGPAAALQEAGWRKPNDLGLFDLHGNAAEWCQDAYRPRPAADAAPALRASELGETVGDERRYVHRGGSFRDPPPRLRSAARDSDSPATRQISLGFRVARSYP